MKAIDKEALREWEEFIKNVARSTEMDEDRSIEEIEKHKRWLEDRPVEWIKFFFPQYCKYEFAPFHVKAIKRILRNPEWFEVLSWSRELAKSTVTMFIVLYLTLTGKKKFVVLASSTKDAAERLLTPYKGQLEGNARIKAYYGEQKKLGQWTSTAFTTNAGVGFVALGSGDKPRGARNENIRPDILLLDDYDTDEECRNPDVLQKKWDWWEKALYPTRSISEPTLIIFCGNIIAEDCCIKRAGDMADNWDIVNIRDKDGKSTWPNKNTEELIDIALRTISKKTIQGEYYNNPVSEGEIFKEIHYGKIPDLSKFRFLIIYGDPAPGENKSKKSSTKAVALTGMIGETLYVIKCFCARALNSEFIEWYARLQEYVNGKAPAYLWMENNKLQDPFFQQIFKPLVRQYRKNHDACLFIQGDEERKTDKASRIEANLEPLNREGLLIFNEKEKENEHMKEMANQFKLFNMQLKYPADGPDTIEGALRKIRQKMKERTGTTTISVKVIKKQNKKRL